MLCNCGNTEEKENRYIDSLLSNNVDGIITATGKNKNRIEQLEVPVVAIDTPVSEKILTIVSDNFKGGYIGVQYLDKKDCKKLLYVKGPNTNTGTKRYEVF